MVLRKFALQGLLSIAVYLGPTVSLAQYVSASVKDAARVTVETADGPVHGYVKDGVNIFLGIPYAAPPIGGFRWMPPRPVRHWTAIRDATAYSSNCPQVTTFATFAGPTSVNEDCLYLNIFTTGVRPIGKKKPVIVWVHGGGNVDGESTDYDGSKLATGGPEGVETVVVTFNYRLGLFGTYSHAALNAESHPWGNYGTMDQQAVLLWVQRNISRFGGDPDKVTMGGQSAGAYDVGANMLSPLSKGLFHRAIFQSSPAVFYILPTADEVLKKGMAFAEASGCPGSDTAAAQCLRNLSAARILQLQGTLAANSSYVTLMPFVDGTIVPMQPEVAWNSGRFNKMPVMGGATRDEITFVLGFTEYYSGWPQTPMSATNYSEAIRPGAFCNFCKDSRMPGNAAAQYPLEKYGGNPVMAYQRLNTDVVKCRELHVMSKWASQVPTYAYDFTYDNAPTYFPQMPGFKAGAMHTADIQFLFNHYHGGPLGVNLDQATGRPRELNAAEEKLSDQMVAAWTHFADTGNPNGNGDRPWPRFSADSAGQYLAQDIPQSTIPVSQFRAAYKCDFWDSQLPLRN